MSSPIFMYTDGSTWPNPGTIGGWGVVIVDGDKYIELNGQINEQTTNSRAEILAVIAGLTHIEKINLGHRKIVVVSDSNYVVKTMKDEWKTTKNHDLWKTLKWLSKNKIIDWQWVKGHSGHVHNERCDVLAEMGRTGKLLNG